MKKAAIALIRDMNEQIQSMQNELSDARARLNMLWGIVKKREEEGIESLKKYGYSSTPAIETEDIRSLFGWGPSKACEEAKSKIDIVSERIKSEEEKMEPIEEETEEDKRQRSIKEYAEKIKKAGEKSADKKEDQIAEAVRLREERNAKIIRLHEEGETIAKIAAEVECSEGTVCNVLKKWRER